MKSLRTAPLGDILGNLWTAVPEAYRKAFFWVAFVSVLAFGFEMTNLTLHHDDVLQIFTQDATLQQYVGRFGFGWLHYVTQGAYFMPFVQMVQGIVLMAAYGLLVARLWGLRGALETTLVASILCVYPYIAQTYQYNTSQAIYPLAYAMTALGVALAVRARALSVLGAAALFLAAFSIYQSVISNALTILGIWAMLALARPAEGSAGLLRPTLISSAATLIAIGLGGVAYVAAVKALHLPLDADQGAEAAFRFEFGAQQLHALKAIAEGTRASLLWPENYFPLFLKLIQIGLLLAAAACWLWLPRRASEKLLVALALPLTVLAPRLLQFLHPGGNYHALTLTAYAVLVAGAVATLCRSGPLLVRNLACCAALVLLAGYVVQGNRISTVNSLNMQAHYATTSQILARLRALPDQGWDGKRIVAVGRYRMTAEYPFRRATGVAPDFIDWEHLQALARLLREDVEIVSDRDAGEAVKAFAAARPIWPHPSSVGIVDGVGVVVLDK